VTVRLLRALIGLCLPPADRALLLRELDELFAQRAGRSGRAAAMAWYSRQALGFLVRVGTARLAEGIGRPDAYAADARVALRYFRRRPSFAIATVLTLGVGTGVLSAVYAAAEWLLLRPVPGVARAGELMTLRLGMSKAPAHASWAISHPDFLTLRERLPLDGRLAAFTPMEVDVQPGAGVASRVDGELVTSNYFEVLQHTPAAGRLLLAADDDAAAGPPVVVLSHDLARSLYARAADAIGADLRVNGAVVTVVGITAPGFRGAELPGRARLWIPLGALTAIDPTVTANTIASRGSDVWRRMIARAPGTSAFQLSAAANGIMQAIQREFRGRAH
jgi:hypothetical protein